MWAGRREVIKGWRAGLQSTAAAAPFSDRSEGFAFASAWGRQGRWFDGRAMLAPAGRPRLRRSRAAGARHGPPTCQPGRCARWALRGGSATPTSPPAIGGGGSASGRTSSRAGGGGRPGRSTRRCRSQIAREISDLPIRARPCCEMRAIEIVGLAGDPDAVCDARTLALPSVRSAASAQQQRQHRVRGKASARRKYFQLCIVQTLTAVRLSSREGT